MIALNIAEALLNALIIGVCIINAFKWFNVTLTDKIKLYPFDRYYSLFLCVIFAYASSCFIEEGAKKLKVIVGWFSS